MSKLTERVTAAIFVASVAAASFIGGAIYKEATTPAPASCIAAMDWTDAAIRVAGEAWADEQPVPETYREHAAEAYHSAEDCRAGR